MKAIIDKYNQEEEDRKAAFIRSQTRKFYNSQKKSETGSGKVSIMSLDQELLTNTQEDDETIEVDIKARDLRKYIKQDIQ
jgi:hypothetical protein